MLDSYKIWSILKYEQIKYWALKLQAGFISLLINVGSRISQIMSSTAPGWIHIQVDSFSTVIDQVMRSRASGWISNLINCLTQIHSNWIPTPMICLCVVLLSFDVFVGWVCVHTCSCFCMECKALVFLQHAYTHHVVVYGCVAKHIHMF